jgi:hypothetical protein
MSHQPKHSEEHPSFTTLVDKFVEFVDATECNLGIGG